MNKQHCPKCNGYGAIECPAGCPGGDQKCGTCYGAGMITCNECDGRITRSMAFMTIAGRRGKFNGVPVRVYCSVYELPDGSRYYGDNVYGSADECDGCDVPEMLTEHPRGPWVRLGYVELTGVDRNRSNMIDGDQK